MWLIQSITKVIFKIIIKTQILPKVKCVSFTQFVTKVPVIHFHKNVKHLNEVDEFLKVKWLISTVMKKSAPLPNWIVMKRMKRWAESSTFHLHSEKKEMRLPEVPEVQRLAWVPLIQLRCWFSTWVPQKHFRGHCGRDRSGEKGRGPDPHRTTVRNKTFKTV